jgi:hypothetical protein
MSNAHRPDQARVRERQQALQLHYDAVGQNAPRRLSCERRRAMLKAMLQMLAHDEPVGPCERINATAHHGERLSKQWPKVVFATAQKYPGYQPGYLYRENMKYGRTPAKDAPLDQHLAALINHAKAKWSGYIDGKGRKLQFVDWLPSYLDDDTLRYDLSQEEAATQFLRASYGMPYRAPKKRGGK